MTNQQILERVIKKAIEGGWDTGYADNFPFDDWYYDEPSKCWFWSEDPDNVMQVDLNSVIFDHSFCKALWPEGHCAAQQELNADDPARYLTHSEYHIQQLALAEDRIEYLEENT